MICDLSLLENNRDYGFFYVYLLIFEVKMGCCISRIDSKLVKLCKERKELIKDARDHQCSLAFAHMAYFQSLQDAENEFSNFMNEVIVIYHVPPSDTITDHLKEQFPQSENSSLGNSDESKDEEVVDNVCVKGGSNLSEFQSENKGGKVYYSKEAINSKTCFSGVPDNVLHQPQVVATNNPEHLSIESFKGVTDQTWYEKIVESSNPGSLRFPQSESAGLRPSGNPVFPPTML